MAPLGGREEPFAASREWAAERAWALGAGAPVASVVSVVLGCATEMDLVPLRVLERADR